MLSATWTGLLPNSWTELFNDLDLDSVLSNVEDPDTVTTCPTRDHVFRCFSYFDVLETKVVICGQDPYHTPGVANGLAFDAVCKRIPPLYETSSKRSSGPTPTRSATSKSGRNRAC